MEDRFSKMTDKELQQVRRDIDHELETREEERKLVILKTEEKEAKHNLVIIDSLILISKHSSNNCNDNNLCEDGWNTDENSIKCIKCYLMSCKKYEKTPDLRISLNLEKYQVYGR